MIEAVFRGFVLASPAFASTKVYQNRIPQSETEPVAAIRKLDSDGTQDMGYQPGHATTRYRVSVYCRSFAELVAHREGLVGLDGWNIKTAADEGRDDSFQVPGSELQSAIIVFDQDSFEEDSQTFQLLVDFEIHHNQTVPPIPTVP